MESTLLHSITNPMLASLWFEALNLDAKNLHEDQYKLFVLIWECYLQGELCLKLSEEQKEVWESLESSLKAFFVLDHNYLYFRHCFEMQQHFNRRVEQKLKDSFQRVPIEQSDLLPLQKKAVETALSTTLTIIAGGPGTGKSWTIQKLLVEANKNQWKAVIGTPTGKAAANLREKIKDTPIHTLHYLLSRCKQDLVSCDLCVLEEASMVDLKLFLSLLDHLKPTAKLVLVGDPYQLPPVGLGRPFHQLCKDPKVPQVVLTQVMRTDNPDILQLTEALKNQKSIKVQPLLKPQELLPLFAPLLEAKTLEEYFSFFEGFRILTPLKQGCYGVESLNRLIHDFLASQSQYIPILVTANQMDQNLYNGDFCLKKIDEPIVYFPDQRTLPLSLLPSYDLAYVLSIHKSQGSEFDDVVVLLPEQSDRFDSSLLYTAVTRAKKTVKIYADPQVAETHCY